MSRKAPHEMPSTHDHQGYARNLDETSKGERTKAPPNLIRRPVKLPPMKRIQGG